MAVWSLPGSHPRRRTDRGGLQREGNRRSSQALRGLVRVWRREVHRRMLWNWTKYSDTEGQTGGRMFEAEARMFSGGCNSRPVSEIGLAWSYIIDHSLFPEDHLFCGLSVGPLRPVAVPVSLVPSEPLPLILILSRAFCSCTNWPSLLH